MCLDTITDIEPTTKQVTGYRAMDKVTRDGETYYTPHCFHTGETGFKFKRHRWYKDPCGETIQASGLRGRVAYPSGFHVCETLDGARKNVFYNSWGTYGRLGAKLVYAKVKLRSIGTIGEQFRQKVYVGTELLIMEEVPTA